MHFPFHFAVPFCLLLPSPAFILFSSRKYLPEKLSVPPIPGQSPYVGMCHCVRVTTTTTTFSRVCWMCHDSSRGGRPARVSEALLVPCCDAPDCKNDSKKCSMQGSALCKEVLSAPGASCAHLSTPRDWCAGSELRRNELTTTASRTGATPYGPGEPPGQSLCAGEYLAPCAVTYVSTNMGDDVDEHTGKQCHQCSFCGRGFPQRGHLVSHLRIHSGEAPHQCSYCGSGFTRRGTLVSHIRTHTGERPYQCDYCGRGFADSSALKTHLRIHTGEKPFQCQLCPMAFYRKEHLVRHVLAHKNEKPFQCQFCSKAFIDRYRLNYHLKRNHIS
ncbi:uncharacterized protein LOC144132968 isoform X2 [Amblyomma americanum]